MQAFSFLTICYLSDLPRGEEKRAAPVLNSRIVQIEASFICSLLEFSLRAFFFLGWRFGSIVQFFACLFAFLLLD